MLTIKSSGKYRVLDYKATYTHVINEQESVVVIRSANFSEIKPFQKEAEREHLLFAESTNYFLATVNDVPIGFFGLLLYSEKAVHKNVYVFQQYRGNKLWDLFYDATLTIVKNIKNIKQLEASATPIALPLYLRRGAIEVARYKTFDLVKIKIPL